MSAQWKWVIGVVSIVVVLALLACGIFFAWSYFFPGKPSVVITAPPSNYQALEGDEVTVEARATGRSIERVELWVDDGLMDTASSPSPQDAFSAALTWQASGVGPHTVEVKAYDARGQASEPAAIVLIVATELAEATPTVTVGPSFETPTPTPSPTPTATSAPGATATPTSPPPTATPTLAPPVIDSFTIDDSTITDGETTWLRWEFHNATESHLYRDAVEIDSGLPSLGDRPVNPHVTRTFKLVVSNAAGSAEASVTLTVNPAGPPVIESFTASPDTINAGDSTTLSWGLVTNATSVTIDQGIGGVATPGSTVVSPGSTTTYTMTAVGPGGTTTASVTVTVTPAGPTTVTRKPLGGNESGTVYEPASGIGVLYTHSIAGDTATNWHARGYMSFDISDLSGVSVVSAGLDVTGCPVTGDPFGSSLAGIWVGELQYSLPLDQADYNVMGTGIVKLTSAPGSTIDVTSFVQNRVNQAKARFQIRLHPAGPTDGDSNVDWINCHLSVPVLTVTYNIPSPSDRNLKENFALVEGQEVLARLAEIPIQTWNFKSQESSIRHIGPMAQDFYAAFGLGADDKHIRTVDADGVALAAIQALYQLSQEQDAHTQALEAEKATLQQRLDDLEALVAALEAGAARPVEVGFLPDVWSGVIIFLAGLGLGWLARRGGRPY